MLWVVVELAADELDRLHELIAGRFARAEPRARVRRYVSGLVAGLERKNGWTLAEEAGEIVPDGMQRLLRRADWDVDGVRDDARGYAIGHLGDPGGVLIADETGFIKKGTQSAGVQRQYSGTAGRTENCQVGVFLAYASVHGHALIDRELYLPRSWAEDRERCREAGIPEDTEFATKPQLAQAMISRAIEAGVPFAWFTADEAYGQAKWLQDWLEERDVSCVMAIRRSDTFTMTEGERRADDLTAAAPARSWQKISAGAGAHGPREYHWTRVPVRTGWRPGRGHWLLARRSLAAARAGTEETPHHSVAVQLFAQEAKAWARIGDHRQTEVALDKGRRLLSPCRTRKTSSTTSSWTRPSSTSTRWTATARSQTTRWPTETLAKEVIQASTDFDGRERAPMRLAEARITLSVIRAREGDLDSAIDQGQRALNGDRKSLPSLLMVTRDLTKVLNDQYPAETKTRDYLDQLATLTAVPAAS